jgi:outer membrane protein assembly factor BamD
MKRLLYFLPLGLLAISACSRSGVREGLPPNEQYQQAMKSFEKKNYLKAQSEFQKVIYSYPGLSFIDTAQYYLGMSYLDVSSYSEAAGEFKRFLATYPASPLADQAQYNLAMSYFNQSPGFALDQTDTYSAIDEFSVFLDKYSESPLVADAKQKLDLLNGKLAKKLYKAGELYMKLNDFEPALIYFGQVRDNYPSSEWAAYAFYYSGEAQMKLGRKSEALETFQNFMQAFPDHKLAHKAQKNIAILSPVQTTGS